MYIQGHPQYEYHVKTYGHPSQFGYKDIIGLWQTPKWDPDRLMRLYKEAGARYFVVMAVHHDNFDLWNSKYHRWNSVNFGPHRDIVGEWRRAALAQGLRFGVTEHNARSYSWFQTNKGSDKTGPLAGVPYDGNDPRYRDLYHPPFPDSPRYPENPPASWTHEWYLRTRDLLDSYQPDLFYFDGGVPFGEVGLRLITHYYNANRQWHDGRLEAVLCVKRWASGHGAFVEGTCVEDVERGLVEGIRKQPWQTDTCVGQWFYRRDTRYKSATQIIHLLIDIVSKNGNLLLNFPLRPEGDLDAEAEKVLHELAAWFRVNGEAIYGTRPWLSYGEGPTRVRGGHFSENISFRPRDIRFTTKAGALYAFTLGLPTQPEVLIQSLRPAEGRDRPVITHVELLGHRGALSFRLEQDGLHIALPKELPGRHALAFRILGKQLKPSPVAWLAVPEPDGRIILRAADAEIHGDSPRYESGAGKDNIGYWHNPKDYVSWPLRVERPGRYAVEIRYSCASGADGSAFTITLAGHTLSATSHATGSWTRFRNERVGEVEVPKAGPYLLTVQPKTPPRWKVIGLQSVTLIPLQK